jgi:demethylmenaquinone methyltransferase/2-methoxy-6-polyprenyl-1,4-benzoquinol methylase
VNARLEQALAHYRELAPRYDHFTRRINAIRLRAIDALALAPGDVVLDAGCGTGWCLPHLLARVGAHGHVIGFDPSPDMLDVARTRCRNDARVTLLRAAAAEVALPRRVDAILFSYTHDLIRSPPALDNLFAQAKEAARVAATSTKLYARWLVPANWYLRVTHRRYITNFEGFEAPWSLLAGYLDGFRVTTGPFTQHYVAAGHLRHRSYEAKKTK